ncbi:MAG: type VI secretion system baseplate subunit TssE, partial [Myxococcota bacterium]
RLGAPSGSGRSASEGVSAIELKRSVARDLEWLLNTRVWTPWNLEALEEAGRSILNYGIPELSAYSWASADDATAIKLLIENAIRTFEPRLLPRSIRTELLPGEDVADFRLRIRIEAILQVEPISEPVVFDTGMDLEGGGLRVERFE